jgi:hypothetical protein
MRDGTVQRRRARAWNSISANVTAAYEASFVFFDNTVKYGPLITATVAVVAGAIAL